MVSDVLSKFDDRDRNEDDGDGTDGSPVDVARLRVQAGLKKGELRIVDDACDGEGSERFEGAEAEDLHGFDVSSHADEGEDKGKEVAGADADDEGDELDGLVAFDRANDDDEEGDKSADNREEVVSAPVIGHRPRGSGSRKGETDQSDDRSDDDRRKKLVDPSGTNKLDDDGHDDVDKARHRDADEHAPIAEAGADDRAISA